MEVSCERPSLEWRSRDRRRQVQRNRQTGVDYGLSRVVGEPMICDICGRSGAHVRRVSRSYGRGASLFVIENIPIVSCPTTAAKAT